MMETKALRVFYRKSDNQIVWTHELRGTGVFPTTIEQDIVEIPNTMPDGETRLGGIKEDYACIEEPNSQKAGDALESGDNTIVDGKLIIGIKRIAIELEPARNTLTEIDGLRAELKNLKTVVKTLVDK